MRSMDEYHWAQEKIDETTGIQQQTRHRAQRKTPQHRPGESRASRREREREERRFAKKVKT